MGESGREWAFDTDEQLGPRGGFGAVYRGEADDGTPVAVKLVDLRGRVSSRRLLQREKEVADKLRTVEAKHLIRVLDAAETKTEVLLVMELAEGSLAAHLEGRGEPLTPVEALAVLRDVTAGLRELHQASVVHRDLKPANVLMHEGLWKLADFGIARDAELGTQNPTFVGWGTFAYMAPESWRGESPSFKTDLYSLGCMACELLTGEPPFPGPDEEDYRRQHLEEPSPDPGVGPAALRRVVLRLLSKDPAERQQDARAVEETLARVVVQEKPGVAASDRLAQLALEHAAERAAEQAAQSAAREARERREAQRRQAARDIDDILQAAAETIQQQLADVEYRWEGTVPSIAGPDASLDFRLYTDFEFGPDTTGETAVGFGEVVGGNRRGSSGVVLGNVVYEDLGDGVHRWVLYRFRAQGALRDYPLGPTDRAHGLSLNHFLEHRRYMLTSVTHIFVTSREPLSPEDVHSLYAEALAMPALPG